MVQGKRSSHFGPPGTPVLSLVPGAKPKLTESSCCGMAGSFGYEAEHYEVSMQMAKANLLPAPDCRWGAAGGGACGKVVGGADGLSGYHYKTRDDHKPVSPHGGGSLVHASGRSTIELARHCFSCSQTNVDTCLIDERLSFVLCGRRSLFLGRFGVTIQVAVGNVSL